jgi:hypothetical protein
MNSLLAKAALLSITLSPMLMRADVVFSNYNGAGSAIGSHFVCGASSCNNTIAEEFTPSLNFTMTDAQVLVAQNVNGNDQTFDVYLSSNGGTAPGAVIEQIGFGLSPSTATYPGSLITANSIGTPITLLAGTPYWLVLKPHLANSQIVWVGSGSQSVPSATSLDGGNTWPFAGGSGALEFVIDGTPVAAAVPEPSSLVLLLAGIVTLLYGIRERHAKA